MNKAYIQGETIAIAVPDGGYESAVLQIGAGAPVAMSLADGAWSASISSAGLSGIVRLAVFATVGGAKVAVESGAFSVRPLVSKYAAVVEAIDSALQSIATNGKYSVSVGDISITDKTFDEMVKFRAYYQGLAQDEETGEATTGRVGIIQARF